MYKFAVSPAQLVGEYLEGKCMETVQDALEYLELDLSLYEDMNFMMEVDNYVLRCQTRARLCIWFWL